MSAVDQFSLKQVRSLVFRIIDSKEGETGTRAIRMGENELPRIKKDVPKTMLDTVFDQLTELIRIAVGVITIRGNYYVLDSDLVATLEIQKEGTEKFLMDD